VRITNAQRAALVLDVVILWRLRPPIFADLSVESFRRARLVSRALRVSGLIFAGIMSTMALWFSIVIATIPGEWQETALAALNPPMRRFDVDSDGEKETKSVAVRDLWFAGDVNGTTRRRDSLFSNTLVLPGFSLYEALKIDEPKKLAWKEHLIDLRGRHLEKAVLDFADLTKADLTDAWLQGASFFNAHLQKAILQGAQLQDASLDWARLQSASLEKANLQGASLLGAQLQGASLYGADLQGAELTMTNLQGASLMNAHLQGAILNGGLLQGATLEDANLQSAVLVGARLEGASFKGTQLQGHHSLGRKSRPPTFQTPLYGMPCGCRFSQQRSSWKAQPGWLSQICRFHRSLFFGTTSILRPGGITSRAFPMRSSGRKCCER
jgi:uncharacterized protein YjbI with pentapeptide repeats